MANRDETMSDPSRPPSRWSTSMSITTKSTGGTNQTIPLINVRKKLFRQSTNSAKILTQRTAKSKHDIGELFKLYYSNDIKFDTFQRQIVTGTRIPTARLSPQSQNNTLTNSSTNVFNSKHCVSREQLSTSDLDCNEQQPSTKRPVQSRIEDDSPVLPSRAHLSPPMPVPVLPNLPIASSPTQQNELYDSSLVKSVAFLEDISSESHENINTKKTKSNIPQRSKSTLLTVPPRPPPPPPPPPLSVMDTNRKDPAFQSHTSFSPMTPVEQQRQNHPTVVTGSAVTVRQRSSMRQIWNKQRTKSNLTMTTNISPQQSTTKTCSPTICGPLPIQSDTPEFPVFVGAQRVVSIPSKCSRYVLVSFPEVPLRYNAPSYVERLLLPERFPTLFHNIVHSYDHHLTNFPSHRNAK